MTIETMTPAWVVENYLPNFKARFDVWQERERKRQTKSLIFVLENFSEALSELLKAQRNECAAVLQIYAIGDNSFANVLCKDIVEASKHINKAPTPTPENRQK